MSADSTVDPAGEPLLDGALPESGFSRPEGVALAAAPPVAYEAASGLDLLTIGVPLVNAGVGTRLPERLAAGPCRPRPPRGLPTCSAHHR